MMMHIHTRVEECMYVCRGVCVCIAFPRQVVRCSWPTQYYKRLQSRVRTNTGFFQLRAEFMLQGIQNNNLLLVSNFPTTGVRIHWPTVIMFVA